MDGPIFRMFEPATEGVGRGLPSCAEDEAMSLPDDYCWYCVVGIRDGRHRYVGMSIYLAAKRLRQNTVYGKGASREAAIVAAHRERSRICNKENPGWA